MCDRTSSGSPRQIFPELLRGEGVPASEFERRCKSGIGWTPTNIQITFFDNIAETPFGSTGEGVPRGPPRTRTTAGLSDCQTIYVALGNTADLSGTPWESMACSMLSTSAARLLAETGLGVRASFAHAFILLDPDQSSAFSLAGFVHRAGLADASMTALQGMGIEPDIFLSEFS